MGRFVKFLKKHFILSAVAIFHSCSGQNFEYQDYVKEVNFSMPSIFQQEDIIKIEDYLPKNYVKNASVDYTAIIQTVLNKNRRILFPNFPLLIMLRV